MLSDQSLVLFLSSKSESSSSSWMEICPLSSRPSPALKAVTFPLAHFFYLETAAGCLTTAATLLSFLMTSPDCVFLRATTLIMVVPPLWSWWCPHSDHGGAPTLIMVVAPPDFVKWCDRDFPNQTVCTMFDAWLKWTKNTDGIVTCWSKLNSFAVCEHSSCNLTFSFVCWFIGLSVKGEKCLNKMSGFVLRLLNHNKMMLFSLEEIRDPESGSKYTLTRPCSF